MKVKENLVYDKFTGSVIGFANLGEMNNELLALKQKCKKWWRSCTCCELSSCSDGKGNLFKVRIPPCPFWNCGHKLECVRQVEGIGLKAIFITANGNTPLLYPIVSQGVVDPHTSRSQTHSPSFTELCILCVLPHYCMRLRFTRVINCIPLRVCHC